VLDNIGTLVAPKDIIALASAMEKMYTLSAHDRAACGGAAYDHVVQHFSIPKFHEQFWKLPQVQQLK
jgi:hypothetical protein